MNIIKEDSDTGPVKVSDVFTPEYIRLLKDISFSIEAENDKGLVEIFRRVHQKDSKDPFETIQEYLAMLQGGIVKRKRLRSIEVITKSSIKLIELFDLECVRLLQEIDSL